MSIPEEIRKVKRPVNTVVIDNGTKTPFRYAVRARKGVRYVPGKCAQPIMGEVIGHIIDGVFVPKVAKTAVCGPQELSYAGAALIRDLSKDLKTDLLKCFPADDAFAIMAIAGLRVLYPRISCRRYSTHYLRSFISVFFPGISISANSVCNLLKKVGIDTQKRRDFYLLRMKSVTDSSHIAIDGTLVQDNSTINDLSKFSYKAKKKGCKEISILYAFDIDKMEPICAEVFPGNNIDSTTYKSFIKNNKILKGTIITDKGFPVSKIKTVLEDNPQLHYLTPIKRNDKRIEQHQMLDFQGVFSSKDASIYYKKHKLSDNSFLYSFRDPKLTASEDFDFADRANRKNDYDIETYNKKKDLFGVIVFESDLDATAEQIYRVYEDRWLLELVFKQYKRDLDLDISNVQGDYSVVGSEFINFIATIITCRIFKRANQLDLFKNMSYGDLIDDLNSAWRKTAAPNQQPQSDDEYWVHTMPSVLKTLEKLGLSDPVEITNQQERKKAGRPKKKPEFVGPKRSRGRPKKQKSTISSLNY